MASPPSGSAPQRPACCGRLCRRREKWKRSDSGIDRVTLRFADPMREKGFADTHKAQLTRYVWLSIGAIVTVGLLVSVTAHRFWDDSQYPTSEARELSQWQMLIFYSSFVFLLLTLAAGLILTKHSVVNTLGLEVLVVSANVCFMMTMAIIPKHYIARAFGHENAEAIWGVDLGPTDGSLVLYIDLVVTSLHLLLPIRWIVLVPLEVIAILVYIVPAVLLGSPAMNFVPFNIIGLMVLTLFAAIGKRSFERQERILFAGLLQEKQKRFQAEFQLSKADNTGVPSKAEGFGSELSVPGTTMSSAAFGDSVGPASLDQIRAIGTREKWFIAKGEVQLLPDRILGQGGFGIVVLGLYHNTMVAVKAPKQEIANKGRISSYLPALCNELRILRHIRHPSIAFLYGASIDVALNKLCLVLEFVDGVPLSKFIRPSADKEGAVESRPGALETMGESSSQSARALIISDILNVLRYLHSRQPAVVHGDLKVSNVFVEERRSRSGQSSYHAKLLDFGLSRILTRSARPLGGTPRWMAPELLAVPRVPPDAAADSYSFGLLTYFVVTGRFPFEGKREEQVLKRLRRGQLPSLTWPAPPDGLTEACRPAVGQCVQAKAALRLSTEQVSYEMTAMLTQVARRTMETAMEGLGSAPVGTEFNGLVELKVCASGSASSLGPRVGSVDLSPVAKDLEAPPSADGRDDAAAAGELSSERAAHPPCEQESPGAAAAAPPRRAGSPRAASPRGAATRLRL